MHMNVITHHECIHEANEYGSLECIITVINKLSIIKNGGGGASGYISCHGNKDLFSA